MNIHGAGRAERRRRKACTGWSWAAACGIQGWRHIAWLPRQLVVLSCLYRKTITTITIPLRHCSITSYHKSTTAATLRFIMRQHAMHAEPDIVLPIPSMCLFNAVLCLDEWT